MFNVKTEISLSPMQLNLVLNRAIVSGFVHSGHPSTWSERTKKQAVRYVIQECIWDLLERGEVE